MSESSKAAPPETRALTVKWPADHFERIEEAARLLSEQTQASVTPTDIIRAGALMRANAVLGAA